VSLPVSESQITFQSGGKDIGIDCFLPVNAGETFPAVIGLHGSGGNYAGMADPGRLLAAGGIAVYVLHYFDRTKTLRVDGKATILRNSPLWLKTLWDCISFVGRQPNIASDRIGLLGFSLGAYLALSDAVVDSRIKAVVEFFGGLPKEIRPFTRRLCPVLILHGDADQTVPVQEAYDLRALLEKKQIPYEMKIYPGVEHGFTGEVWRDASELALVFLKKYLLR